jgi:hypothetical protein
MDFLALGTAWAERVTPTLREKITHAIDNDGHVGSSESERTAPSHVRLGRVALACGLATAILLALVPGVRAAATRPLERVLEICSHGVRRVQW